MLPEDICNYQNQGSSFTPVNTAFCSRKHLIRKKCTVSRISLAEEHCPVPAKAILSRTFCHSASAVLIKSRPELIHNVFYECINYFELLKIQHRPKTWCNMLKKAMFLGLTPC